MIRRLRLIASGRTKNHEFGIRVVIPAEAACTKRRHAHPGHPNQRRLAGFRGDDIGPSSRWEGNPPQRPALVEFWDFMVPRISGGSGALCGPTGATVPLCGCNPTGASRYPSIESRIYAAKYQPRRLWHRLFTLISAYFRMVIKNFGIPGRFPERRFGKIGLRN